MKRISAILVLALIIVAVCSCGNIYIFHVEKNLNSLMGDANTYIKQKDYENAAKAAEKAEKYFVENEKAVSVFCDHELVENLGVALSRLSPLSKEETEYEFISELNSSSS